MSLEQKIENLTAAIENLTAVMTTSGAVIPDAQGSLKEVITEELKAECQEKVTGKSSLPPSHPSFRCTDVSISDEEAVVEEVTIDQVKTKCLEISRAEAGNKVKVKALLAEYKATVVKDLSVSDRATVLARLEKGEY
tara:strand:+ start:691 stop:1101 length:411 start_codon:yes stop_codon:yes gene_type:complete